MVSFAFQLDNGIPILPYYHEKDDDELLKIADYLIALKDDEDVRMQNRATFGIQDMYKLNVPSFIKYYSEEENNTDSSFESSFESATEADNINIGKKTEKIVESELGKFKETFPLYLASQDVDKNVKTNSERKERDVL